MTINDAFPRKCCINLDRRPDRWRRMSDRLAANGFEGVVRVAAVDEAATAPPPGWSGTPGAFGCLLSHVSVVRRARDAGADSLLVLEDDVDFAPAFAHRFAGAFGQVPADWDLLYFGCIHRSRPEPVSDAVARVTRAFSTFAYGIRRRAFEPFLAVAESAVAPIDVQLGGLQGELACYCFFPHLAWVEPDFSDVQGMADDHWYIRESLVMEDRPSDFHGSGLAVILRDAPGWRDAGPDVLAFFVEHLRDALPGLVVTAVDGAVSVVDWIRRAGHEVGEEFSYVLSVGSPTFVRRRYLQAALQMCAGRDLVVPFGASVQLDDSGTREVLEGRGARLDASRYPRLQADGLDLGWFFLTRQGLASAAYEAANAHPFLAPSLGLCLKVDAGDGRHAPANPRPASAPLVLSVPSRFPVPVR
jgi:hypothetical protein